MMAGAPGRVEELFKVLRPPVGPVKAGITAIAEMFEAANPANARPPRGQSHDRPFPPKAAMAAMRGRADIHRGADPMAATDLAIS